jgi:ABC-2 type transport system permease protein
MFTNTLTIAGRTITQLVRDRRTIALVLIVPLVIASLIGFSIPNDQLLDQTFPAVLAMMVLFFGFLLSGISFLRERTQGTMERLMASPVTRLDIVAGYLLGFLLFAIIQTMILFFYVVYVLDAQFQGDLWQVVIFQVLIGVASVCLGIFISVFAKNEFQMIQFIPLIIVPQVFVCGLLFPVSTQPEWLQWIGKFLPLTYGVDGIKAMMLSGQGLTEIPKDVGVMVGFMALFLVAAALSLRRGSSA